MPRLRIAFMCFLRSGWLFESFPNPSNRARTSTPSFAFSASRSKSSEAIESFLKLKYSRCTLLRACLIAQNMSSNFSCPLISSVTLLLSENRMPSSRSCLTMVESLLWASAAERRQKLAIMVTINVLNVILAFAFFIPCNVFLYTMQR